MSHAHELIEAEQQARRERRRRRAEEEQDRRWERIEAGKAHPQAGPATPEEAREREAKNSTGGAGAPTDEERRAQERKNAEVPVIEQTPAQHDEEQEGRELGTGGAIPNEAGGAIIKGAQQAAKAPNAIIKALSSPWELFASLFKASTWIHVVEVLAALIMIVLAVLMFARAGGVGAPTLAGGLERAAASRATSRASSDAAARETHREGISKRVSDESKRLEAQLLDKHGKRLHGAAADARRRTLAKQRAEKVG